jgi:LuxR family transcriptional regulator, maltose regulon positive regulatory protein
MREVVRMPRDTVQHRGSPSWGDEPLPHPAPRVTPPDVPATAVARARLVALLEPAIQRRVTTVVAPPGYGKTVLLSQWAAANPQRNVRWLTVEPEHNDALQFARDVHVALGSSPGAVEATIAGFDSHDPDGIAAFFTALAADLDNAPPTTLVLDDFHRLSNPSLLDGMAALLEHLPPWVHVVIATQVDPPLRHYRLRLQDALVELRQEDLAFRRDEAAELIRRLTGRELVSPRLDALMGRTGGWAVGLQLAAVSLRDRSDAAQFIETFAADDRHVADYLTEHALRHQPAATRQFLLSTSVLTSMNGQLCDHVTRGSGGQSMLDDLERRSMFIARLPGRNGWFRYHPLFRALLRQHLREEDPDQELLLLHRASEWHLARDEVAAAVDYLVEAAAWDDVLDVASTYGRAPFSQGRAAMVVRWIDRVPRSAWEDRPHILLLHAAASIVAGYLSDATEKLDAIDALATATEGDRAMADVLRARWALQQGATKSSIAAADRVLHAVDHVVDTHLPRLLGILGSRDDLRAAAVHTRGMALWHLGKPGARTTLDAVVHDGGDAVWEILGLGSLALVDAWSGRLTSARALGAEALDLARQLELTQQPVSTDAYLALAHVARERDELDRCATFLREAARWASPGRRPVSAELVRIEQALLASAAGGPADGLTVLSAHRARARPHPVHTPAVSARYRALEARLLTMTGDLNGAERALDLAADETSDVTAARVLLAVERGDIQAARAFVAHWPVDPDPRPARELRLWLAILDHLDGDEKTAASRLATVVDDAEAEHDIGVFRAAGHLVLGPARALYRIAPTSFLRTVVDRLAETATHRPGPAKELVEQLTERESMVLVLLPTRLPNDGIAERLGVSPNTLKTHLKHIYRKFGVARRSEAVAAAERMHLL